MTFKGELIQTYLTDNHYRIYSKNEPVRDVKIYIKSALRNNRLIYKTFDEDVEVYIKKYREHYEKYSKRKFEKKLSTGETYQAINGRHIEVMIDHKMDDKDMILFANELMRQFLGNEQLDYIVFEARQGLNGRYLHIWVCDYQRLGEYTKTYSRNQYRNKATGRMCSADDPDCIVIHKAGDEVLDKEGNPILVNDGLARKKTPLLSKTKMEIDRTIKKLIVTTYIALGAKTKRLVAFKRFRIRWDMKDWLKDHYHLLNQKQMIMEVILMDFINKERLDTQSLSYKEDPGSVFKSEDELLVRLTQKGQDYLRIFYEFQARFKKLSFHDEWVEPHSNRVIREEKKLIEFKKGLEIREKANIHRLEEIFKERLIEVSKIELKKELKEEQMYENTNT